MPQDEVDSTGEIEVIVETVKAEVTEVTEANEDSNEEIKNKPPTTSNLISEERNPKVKVHGEEIKLLVEVLLLKLNKF